MQKQIGLGWNSRLTPPEDFSRKATHCVYSDRYRVCIVSLSDF